MAARLWKCVRGDAGARRADDIEPGGWIYKDRTVQMQTMFQKLSTGLFASAGQICWNRFTGRENRPAIHVLPHGRRRMMPLPGRRPVSRPDPKPERFQQKETKEIMKNLGMRV